MKLITLYLLLLSPLYIHAASLNYNSILIGERAAGMGGAYTALEGDTSASPFYNPATLSRMYGTSLSTTANLYSKPDIKYDSDNSFLDASLRINQGSIQPIPSSSGTIHTFGNFAFGLSILVPDQYQYAGTVESSSTTNSYLNLSDETLWVGGSIAVNMSENSSLGATIYYTSRTYIRSTKDYDITNETLKTEDKEFKQNSLIYIFGYHRTFNKNWKLGISHRFESLPISGKGSYFTNTVDSTGGTTDSSQDIQATTVIPAKTTFGLAYDQPKKWTISGDLSFYDSANYKDLDSLVVSDEIIHKPIWNINLGAEYYYKPWLAIRMGIYTNLSSGPELEETATQRKGDHIDMMGFSANAAIFTSPSTTITLGGYYTGGSGYSHEQSGQTIKKLPKSIYNFTFLVATAYQF